MSSQNSRDVIVIGAGVIGCSIALGLARRGFATLNLDALPAAGYGSTSHSSAIVRPFYSHVTSAAIAHESRFRWLNWADYLEHQDERGLAAYTECGGLILVREGDEPAYQANLSILDTVGADYEWLDANAVTRLYPGICLDGFGPPVPRSHPAFGASTAGRIGGGIYLPQAGYVSDPQLAAHNLQAAAVALGSEFSFGTRVVAIVRADNQISGVQLDSGEVIETALLINAAGPHSSWINELAGIAADLPIQTQAQRHEVAYVPAPTGYLESGNGFLVDLDAGTYQRPDGPDLLIGTADPDCDPAEVVDPDDYNTQFTEQWTTQVHRTAQRFPDLPIENTARGTVGLYDVSNDWIPIYDKTDLAGYYLAIGTSGNQFKNAPLVGELIASIVMQGQVGVDHDQTPASLQLPNVGRSVSLDFYSRNRQIQSTSSVLA